AWVPPRDVKRTRFCSTRVFKANVLVILPSYFLYRARILPAPAFGNSTPSSQLLNPSYAVFLLWGPCLVLLTRSRYHWRGAQAPDRNGTGYISLGYSAQLAGGDSCWRGSFRGQNVERISPS